MAFIHKCKSVFDVSCCNYAYQGYAVPECDRQVYNPKTDETIHIDYSGHSLLRSAQRNRQFSTSYLVEVIRDAFDDILFAKQDSKLLILNRDKSFAIIGKIYVSNKENEYVLSIITVISFRNKAVKYSKDEYESVIRTNTPSLLRYNI